MAQSLIDEQVLRFGVLFWDKLVWADSNLISFGTLGEAEFLVQEGILLRPTVRTAFNGSGGDIFVSQQIVAYRELETLNPGRWAIHQGENALVVRGNDNLGRGLLVSLFNAIPVISSDAALEDILSFKLRRTAELNELRSVLDDFYIKVASAEDTVFAFERSKAEIDRCCTDLIRIYRETRIPFRLTNLQLGFELNLLPAVGALIAAGQNMPALTAILGAAATISVGTSSTLAGAPQKLQPYRYAAQFQRDVWSGS